MFVNIGADGTLVAHHNGVVPSTVALAARDSMVGIGKVAQNEERWRAHLEGIGAGNSEALARLYDETSSILYGLALRVLNDPSDAEEVVLDVYQQVWKSTHSFDPTRGTVWDG